MKAPTTSQTGVEDCHRCVNYPLARRITRENAERTLLASFEAGVTLQRRTFKFLTSPRTEEFQFPTSSGP